MSHLIFINQIDTNFICERIASVSFTYYLIIDKMDTRVAVTGEKRRPLQDCFRDLFLKSVSRSLQLKKKNQQSTFSDLFFIILAGRSITFAFVLCDLTAAAVQYWLETTELSISCKTSITINKTQIERVKSLRWNEIFLTTCNQWLQTNNFEK